MLLDDLPVTKAKVKCRVRRKNGTKVQLDLAMIWGQGFGVWECFQVLWLSSPAGLVPESQQQLLVA